jgi:hypothetical protein
MCEVRGEQRALLRRDMERSLDVIVGGCASGLQVQAVRFGLGMEISARHGGIRHRQCDYVEFAEPQG